MATDHFTLDGNDAFDLASAVEFIPRLKRKPTRGQRKREARRKAQLQAVLLGQDLTPQAKRLWWIEYHRYLKSPAWRNFKFLIISERGAVCERCGASGSDKRVDLHHLGYSNLGHETREDVKLLCYRCHQLMHPGKRIL